MKRKTSLGFSNPSIFYVKVIRNGNNLWACGVWGGKKEKCVQCNAMTMAMTMC